MKTPYFNNTDKFVHIGPVTIPPFGTRDVDATHVPGYKPAGADTPEVADELAELLKQSVGKVAEALPSLSLADLDRLGEMEQTGKNRTTLLSAIAEETLNRAGKTVEEIIAGLPLMTDEALAELAAEQSAKGDDADADLVAAITAEQAAREGK